MYAMPTAAQSFLPFDQIDGVQHLRRSDLGFSITSWQWGIWHAVAFVRKTLRGMGRFPITHYVEAEGGAYRFRCAVFWEHERRLHFLNFAHCRTHPTPQFPETPLLQVVGVNGPGMFITEAMRKRYKYCLTRPKPRLMARERVWPGYHTWYFDMRPELKLVCEFREFRPMLASLPGIAESSSMSGEIWSEDAFKAYNFWCRFVAGLDAPELGRLAARNVIASRRNKTLKAVHFPTPEPGRYQTWHL